MYGPKITEYSLSQYAFFYKLYRCDHHRGNTEEDPSSGPDRHDTDVKRFTALQNGPQITVMYEFIQSFPALSPTGMYINVPSAYGVFAVIDNQ